VSKESTTRMNLVNTKELYDRDMQVRFWFISRRHVGAFTQKF